VSNRDSSNGGGVGFFGLLFIVFLVLKLVGIITWSWWWVTAPLWGGFALVAGFMAVAGLLWLIAAVITAASNALK